MIRKKITNSSLFPVIIFVIALLGLMYLFDQYTKTTPVAPPLQQPTAGPTIPLPANPYGITAAEGIPNSQKLTELGVSSIYIWNPTADSMKFLENPLPVLRLGYNRWDKSGYDLWKTNPASTCNKTITLDNKSFNVDYCALKTYIQTNITSGFSATAPHYYVLGNEPNLETDGDSDGLVPPGVPSNLGKEFAAKQYKLYADAIKEIDPNAKIIGPGIIGWLQRVKGKEWLDGFFTTYNSLYGTNPPMDALNIHPYHFEQTANPSAEFSLNEIADLRNWANQKGMTDTPIFITEFGIPNCYANGNSCPTYTDYQTNGEAVKYQAYLAAILNGLETNRNAWKLGSWNLFTLTGATSNDNTNPYRLFDNSGNLTQTGQYYATRAKAFAVKNP